MRAAYHLGIDLGTTFTAAAVVRDGKPETVNLGTRTAAIPSVVFLRDDGSWLVGEAAERRGMSEPNRIAREFKRRFGDPVPIIVGGTPLSPEALTARLLAHVYRTVVERQGGPPDRVVLTHPANWGPYKVDLLRMAVRLAELDGMGEVAFTSEPEAAAIHYASEQAVPVGAVIAVYDLGGGTFDAAVLRRTAGGFEVLGEPEGIERLGGIDIDSAVLDHARAALGPSFASLNPDDPVALAALVNLRRACIDAKEALSSDFDTSFTVVLPTGTIEVRMTRGELEKRIRPALDDTVKALERALHSAGIGTGALHAVLLVGGSSRIPLVGQVVQSGLGVPVALDVDPKHAVAHGAAVLARARATGSDATIALPTAPDPVAAPPAPPPGPVAPAEASEPPRPPEPPSPSPGPIPAGPPPEPRAGRRNLVPVVAVAVVLVAAVVAFVLTQGGGDDDELGAGASTTTPTTGAPDVVDEETTTTTEAEATTTTATTAFVPTTLPPADVESILFQSNVNGDDAIWSMDPDGSNPVPVIDSAGLDVIPTISPDRTRVAYIHAENGEFELRVSAADGSGEPITVLEETQPFNRVDWLPDSSAVVSAIGQELAIIPLDTLEPEFLDLDEGVGPCTRNDPAVAPDGLLLAYRCTFDREDELFVADLETGEVTRLTESPGIDTDAWWIPGSQSLVFRSDRDGDADIYTVGADGSGLRELTDNDVVDEDPIVLPDGRVIFSSESGLGEVDLVELDLLDGEVTPLLARPGIDSVPAG